MKIAIQGSWVEPGEAVVSVLNRSFLFGEGLFETMLLEKGRIHRLEAHLARLEWSALFIGIPFPGIEMLAQNLHHLAKQVEYPRARLKLILSCQNAEGAKPVLAKAHLPSNVVLICEPDSGLDHEDYEVGVDIITLSSVKAGEPPASTLKSTSWLSFMLARQEIAEKDAYDGLFCNHQNVYTEATTGNFFWVREGYLETAPVNLGLLPGVMRAHVWKLAEIQGLRIRENILTPDDIESVDEAFLTSSLVGILPIATLDDSPLQDEEHTIARKLRSALLEETDSES